MCGGRQVTQLTYDFRVEDSDPERVRVTAAGGVLRRLAEHGRGPCGEDEARDMAVAAALTVRRARGAPSLALALPQQSAPRHARAACCTPRIRYSMSPRMLFPEHFHHMPQPQSRVVC